jgi:hypothetical protein
MSVVHRGWDLLGLAGAVLLASAGGTSAGADAWRSTFEVNKTNLSSTGSNK